MCNYNSGKLKGAKLYIVNQNGAKLGKCLKIAIVNLNVRFPDVAPPSALNNGLLRVIDYKTGKPRLGYGGVDALFHGEPILSKRESNIINTLLYSMMLSRDRGRDVRPELYYVGSMLKEEYSPLFVETINRKSRKLEAYSEVAAEFETEVENTLREMFDRSIPFEQCKEDSACKYCDYRTICNRG